MNERKNQMINRNNIIILKVLFRLEICLCFLAEGAKEPLAKQSLPFHHFCMALHGLPERDPALKAT